MSIIHYLEKKKRKEKKNYSLLQMLEHLVIIIQSRVKPVIHFIFIVSPALKRIELTVPITRYFSSKS